MELSPRLIMRVYIFLVLLLALTFGLSFVHLGSWGAPLSLAIAAMKAVLILTYFMKLRDSSSGFRILALGSLFWILFLIGLTASDYLTR